MKPSIAPLIRRTARLLWMVGLLLVTVVASTDSDKPGPFTFVYGLDRGGSLADLQHFGVNTLYIDLQPDDLADLTLVRRQIREASGAGYHVIVGLPTTTLSPYRVSPYSEQYCEAVAEQIQEAIVGLREEAGISAWATGHYLERQLGYHDQDFRQFLQDRYGSLEELNRMWDRAFPAWGAVDQEMALHMAPDLPFGFGRSAADVADYQQAAFHAVMAHWAETVKSLDDSRPLMTGCVTLLRSIPAIPDLYDIIAVNFPPDVIRPAGERHGDALTHNVEGVDLARRGGRFQVISVLRAPLPHEPGYGSGLQDWILAADMHGACGVAVENWDRFVQFPEIAHRTARLLRETLPLVDFSGQPRPTTAVLYSPYAEGFQVAGQPVYGHLRDFGAGTPSTLMAGLRSGTCFGMVDYLTLADVGEVDLARYGLIIAPAALGVTEAQSRVLADYVRAGGALVADLGFGLHHTGSWLRLPGPARGLFGVAEFRPGEARAGDLTVSGQTPEFPHLRHGMRSSGTFRAAAAGGIGSARAYQARTYSVSSYTGYATVTQGALALAVLRTDASGADGPAFAGLIFNRYGRGISLFATHLLYSHWPLADRVSTALHYDLMRRKAGCELVDGPFLPPNAAISLEQDRIRILNSGGRSATHAVALYGQGDRLVKEVINVNRAGYGTGAEQQAFEVTLAPRTIRNLTFTTITAQPYDAHVSVVIAEQSERLVHLVAAGPGARFSPSRANPYQFQRPDAPVRVRFTIRHGAVYKLPNGSRHRVVIQPDRGPTRTVEAVARDGMLSFTEEIYLDQIVVSPAP